MRFVVELVLVVAGFGVGVVVGGSWGYQRGFASGRREVRAAARDAVVEDRGDTST